MRLVDIEAVDSDGNVILSAEIKSRPEKDARWATQFRRNLLAHGHSLGKYFLVVTPDDSFLWRNEDTMLPELREPDSVTQTKLLLGPGLRGDGETTVLSSAALEHLVAAWISTVGHTASPSEVPAAAKGFLLDSGLLAALRDTHVRVA